LPMSMPIVAICMDDPPRLDHCHGRGGPFH
jgi:hypothetical protein